MINEKYRNAVMIHTNSTSTQINSIAKMVIFIFSEDNDFRLFYEYICYFQAAYSAGFECCYCGWLNDGTSKYPMQSATRPGCSVRTGVLPCSFTKADVYCITEEGGYSGANHW